MAQEVFFKEAPTKILGTQFKLAAGASKKFGARPVPVHRKQIIITNQDNTNQLYVINGTSVDPESVFPADSPHLWMTIFPNESKTIFTSDDVYLKASSGGALTYVQVLEVFYAS